MSSTRRLATWAFYLWFAGLMLRWALLNWVWLILAAHWLFIRPLLVWGRRVLRRVAGYRVARARLWRMRL